MSLNGQTLYTGAGYATCFSFTRLEKDTTVYTNSLWKMKIFDAPTDTAEVLVLDSNTNGGITVETNEEATQVIRVEFTATQLEVLKTAPKSTNKLGYIFTVTPNGGSELGNILTKGWEGTFTVSKKSNSAK